MALSIGLRPPANEPYTVLMIAWRSIDIAIASRNHGARRSLFDEPAFTLEAAGALPSRISMCSK